MRISELDAEGLTEEQMTKLLFKGIEDDGAAGDCIFVLGSQSAAKYRVPKAVELYRQGRAKWLLFSGGNSWDLNQTPEAIAMKQTACELGVPEDRILLETSSRHTKENVIASLLVLDRTLQIHEVKRLLVVTTAFHMRRTYLTLRTYMPEWIDYSLCPVDDGSTRADNWWLHESGARRVRSECAKLVKYVQEGIIMDAEL